MKSSSHPFGVLLRKYLVEHSQNDLALEIDQDPAVITRMMRGSRLSGPQARVRVLKIIECLNKWEVLDDISEANALLAAAKMSNLDNEDSDEAKLLAQLNSERKTEALEDEQIAIDEESTEAITNTTEVQSRYKMQLLLPIVMGLFAIGIGWLLFSYAMQNEDSDIPDKPIAVIMGIEPDVQIRRKGSSQLAAASVAMWLYLEDQVSTYDDASANVFCDNGLLFRVPARHNFTVTCQDTDNQTINALQVVSDNDQLLQPTPVFTSTLHLIRVRSTRNEAQATPFLLNPRFSVITSTRPSFQWQPVPEASGYRLSINTGEGLSWKQETTETELLYPDDQSSLTVGSRGIIVKLEVLDTLDEDKVLIDILSADKAKELEKTVQMIATLPVENTTKQYLLIQQYRTYGLKNAAISQLEDLIENQATSSPYLLQQLADLYLEIDWPEKAEETYQLTAASAKTSNDLDAQATAYLGLAHTVVAFDETEVALEHLTKAEALFRQVGNQAGLEITANLKAQLKEEQ